LFGLPPGEYYVSASWRSFDYIQMNVSSSGASDGFAPTYFPGTGSVGEARRVAVRAGQDLTNVSFGLIPARLGRVAGRVTTSSGEPLTGGMLMVAPRNDDLSIGPPNMTTAQIRPDGTFYVSDGYVNSRVALFDKDGTWLREWGKKGAGPGEFSNPHGLTLVPGSTDVLVADRENSRLQLFDRIGAFKKLWVGAKDVQTTGRVFCAASDSSGNYYVGIRRADYDTQHTGVVKLDRDWTVVTSIGFGRAGDPVFNAVHDLAVGKDGSIYVAETRTKRVVKLRVIS